MSRAKLPKILILYTGGTFGMTPGLTFRRSRPAAIESHLRTQVPEIESLAQCSIRTLFQMDSCQMAPTQWFELAQVVVAEAVRFDGVVILHGTDTLPYTAAALSYLLSPCPIPIVVTGAQKPLSTLRNDARHNLISAVEVAAHPPPQLQNRVLVIFHDELFLGTRIRKKSAVDFEAFESPRFPKLGSLGSMIQYHEIIHHLPKISRRRPLFCREIHPTKSSKTDPQILKIEVTPQFPDLISNREVLSQLDAILLTLYTSGTGPTSHPHFVQFLKNAKSLKIPVFAITEREHSLARIDAYDSGRELQDLGVHWFSDLTPEAAWTQIWMKIKFDLPLDARLSDETQN